MRRRVHPRTRGGGRVRRRQVPRQRDAGNGGRGRSERSERSPPQSLSSSRCNHIYRKETDQRVAILPPRTPHAKHRAGLSALQPPGTPLALLDELHEERFASGTTFRTKTSYHLQNYVSVTELIGTDCNKTF